MAVRSDHRLRPHRGSLRHPLSPIIPYDGVRETLVNFLGSQPSTVLEVGCGTGHWLAVAHAERLSLLSGSIRRQPMLDRARVARAWRASGRARAEALCRGATRPSIASSASTPSIISADRVRFFAEARRILRPGGGRADDRQGSAHRPRRLVGLRLLRGDACDRSGAVRAGADAPRRDGAGRLRLDRDRWRRITSRWCSRPARRWPTASSIRSFTSQLTVLSEDEYQPRASIRLRQANDAAGRRAAAASPTSGSTRRSAGSVITAGSRNPRNAP